MGFENHFGNIYNRYEANVPWRLPAPSRLTARSLRPDQLVKLDVQTGSSWCWSDSLWSPSEPVFVPRPGDASDAEDAGVLLASLLHVADPRRTALLVLDAQSMTELARADVTADAAIAKDFHGLFAAAGDGVHRF